MKQPLNSAFIPVSITVPRVLNRERDG